MPKSPDPQTRIAELQAEISRLKKLARCSREPVYGIGGVIQRLRQEKGINLRQLAAMSGVSAGLICRIEKTENCNPELRTLEKIAEGLGEPLVWIIQTYEVAKSESAKEP